MTRLVVEVYSCCANQHKGLALLDEAFWCEHKA